MSFKGRHFGTLAEQLRINELIAVIEGEMNAPDHVGPIESRSASNRFQHRRTKGAAAFDEQPIRTPEQALDELHAAFEESSPKQQRLFKARVDDARHAIAMDAADQLHQQEQNKTNLIVHDANDAYSRQFDLRNQIFRDKYGNRCDPYPYK